MLNFGENAFKNAEFNSHNKTQVTLLKALAVINKNDNLFVDDISNKIKKNKYETK